MSKVIIYNAPPPTQKQYKFARSIATRLNINMPESDDYSVEGFKAFISAHSEDFYKQQKADQEEVKMLNLIRSVDEYEREFGISV